MEKEEKEKEYEAKLNSLMSKSYEEILGWIENKFRKCYSNYINDKDECDIVIKKTMKALEFILFFTARGLGIQTAADLFNNIVRTLLVFEIDNETAIPMEIIFIATLNTAKESNNCNCSYMS